MRTFRFYKDSEGWFIDLPEWTGTKYELAMVMGADSMLDILSENGNEVHVVVSDKPFEGADELLLSHFDNEIGGGYYRVTRLLGINFDFQIWLCDVTRFIFNDMPVKLYISKQY